MAFNPFLEGLQEIVPADQRTFGRDMRLEGFFFLPVFMPGGLVEEIDRDPGAGEPIVRPFLQKFFRDFP